MTIFEAYNDTKKQLKNAGIEDDVFEAKQIIKHITGYSNSQILTRYTEVLTDFQQTSLTLILKQRLARYPLQYILGKWDFYGRSYRVGVGVLIPRQDTETVIENCLELIKDTDSPEILDLCAGTGCIGITLACEKKDSKVTLVEKYEESARYTRDNIQLNAPNNAKLVMGDVLSKVASEKKYDLIVSNPPYVTKEEMANLQAEVKYEPETALFGGEDGLMFYKSITENYKNSLKPGGKLVFEIGYRQGLAVKEILEENGFTDIIIKKDISENDRVVFGTLI